MSISSRAKNKESLYSLEKENIIQNNKSNNLNVLMLKAVCNDYMNGACNRESCKFIHDNMLCKRYWRNHSCKYGNSCRKQHFVSIDLYNQYIEKVNTKFNENKDLRNMRKYKKIDMMYLNNTFNMTNKLNDISIMEVEKILNLKTVDNLYQDRRMIENKEERHQEKEDNLEKEECKKDLQNEVTDLQKQFEENSVNENDNDKMKTAEIFKAIMYMKNKLSDLQLKELFSFITSNENTDIFKKLRKVKNTETFEPMTKPVDMRIIYDLGCYHDTLSQKLMTRDVLLVPNLFRDYEEYEIYNRLVDEIKNCGIPEEKVIIPWHGNSTIKGTHMIASDWEKWKRNSPTFNMVVNRIREFFNMNIKATRLNWYQNTEQWKAFHFDAAKINPEKAKIQNFTVSASFGRTRECAFEKDDNKKNVISIPIGDGEIYCFTKETNELWRHGVLQELPKVEEGRISIVAWGWIDDVIDVNKNNISFV